MTAALVLTTDELRVSTTVAGAPVPAALRADWSTEDMPVADLVALRGLLARGLASSGAGDVSLADDLSLALGPFLTGRVLVDVQRDGAVRPGRRLIAKGAAGVVSCAEHGPDLWQVEPADPDPVERLVADLVDHLPDTEASHPGVTLPTDLLAEAERRSATGATEHTRGMLVRRGLPPGTAEVVARVLGDLGTTVTVRSSHRNGSTTRCAAITWLETGSTGVWLAVPDDDPLADVDPAVPPTGLAGHTKLRPVSTGTLRDEVRDVVEILGSEWTG
ncbi:MAG TPA: hypothetical protein VGX25_16235 [Actinophytocola sp.]|uniref:hypothetical protein n=1 Tax=Actinophytocola sp. TaxID=1872138 RepID=UPI002DDD0B4F|nr:hypothetical protein [Actinophytocola sp.]HEV2780933.1 hypothetical protein [Actinophytocola sp.]